MSPAAAIEAVARRLWLARMLREGAALAAVLALLATGAALAAKAGFAVPRGALAGATGVICAASFAISVRRGRAPGPAEAAYLLDRAGGEERFATWLEFASQANLDPSRARTPSGFAWQANLERECEALGAKLRTSAIVPLRVQPWVLVAAGLAAVSGIAAAIVPPAGEAERAARRAEGGRLRAAAVSLQAAGGAEAAAIRAELNRLADALEQGRLDRAELARALAEARRASEAARELRSVPEALAEAARAFAALERLAGAFELGAPVDEAPRAAAEIAAGEGAEATARALAAAHPALADLARDVASGSPVLAAAAAKRLAAEVAGATQRQASLAGATARLEAAARKLAPEVAAMPTANERPKQGTGNREQGTGNSQFPGSGSQLPVHARSSLPPHLEAAVRRYFNDSTEMNR